MKKIILLLLLIAVPSAYSQCSATAEEQFRKDVASNTIHIYILGGIAARPQPGDADFQEKYCIRFHDFGCSAPGNLMFYVEYNVFVFQHLTEKYGNE